LFDKQNSGRIPAQQIGTVVRSLRQSPTEEEVANIIQKHLKGQPFDLKQLMDIMADLMRNKPTDDTSVREAFGVFDREGHGFISAAELRHVMTNLGEKLTDQEVDELIQGLDIDREGMLQYEELVKMMTSKTLY